MLPVLEKTPHFEAEAVISIAEEHFGISGDARPLPSERDQNFFITTNAGDKFVLKIANALESREFLEAQNSALKHLATQVGFCQSVVPAYSGDEIVTIKAADGVGYFVRMVRFLPGVPLGD